MQEHSTIAAVDLGSNSFRLQIVRVVDDQFYPIDSLKETVRLASGLNGKKQLEAAVQERAIACLKRFNERLRDLPQDAVRVVGTNTFRVMKNSADFLAQAQAALGFPIDIIAGREEARLIYIGVSHGLPPSSSKRLVVDIGGGSTECIIGVGYQPQEMESLHMGCVNFSQRFFADGKISKSALQEAELAARAEAQSIASVFRTGHWDEAIGSSGTARALADVLQQNGWCNGNITAAALEKLRSLLLKASDVKNLSIPGLQPDRIPVIPGGFAIMAGVFAELEIDAMQVAGGALREGVLYDLMGRFQHHDQRDATVQHFMQRYHVDSAQAERVQTLAQHLLREASLNESSRTLGEYEHAQQLLSWAARLHEVGISIAHAGYHKHSAYILGNADMPGFSKHDQVQLAILARTHRGSLLKFARENAQPNPDWELIAVFRLAVLLCRNRRVLEMDAIRFQRKGNKMQLRLAPDWLADNPLSEYLLQEETKQWKTLECDLAVEFGN